MDQNSDFISMPSIAQTWTPLTANYKRFGSHTSACVWDADQQCRCTGTSRDRLKVCSRPQQNIVNIAVSKRTKRQLHRRVGTHIEHLQYAIQYLNGIVNLTTDNVLCVSLQITNAFEGKDVISVRSSVLPWSAQCTNISYVKLDNKPPFTCLIAYYRYVLKLLKSDNICFQYRWKYQILFIGTG